MNKSEVELQNVTDIINAMPVAEKALCTAMISSLMASVGNPIHGQTFMIAVAYTNCQVAVHNIKMGLVNQDGSEPAQFMRGDGRATLVTDEIVAVDEMHKANLLVDPELRRAQFEQSPYAKGGVVGSAKQSVLMGEVPSETVVPRETLLAIKTTANEIVKNRAKAIEARAQEIYEGWHTKEGFIKWVEGGNSIMQTEARYQARKEFEAKESE